MRAPLPQMTYLERCARAQEKAELLLKFLGSGEVFTTAEVAAALLQIDRRRATACLKNLEAQGAVKSESHYVNARKIIIWGITPHGLALADCYGGQFFELSRTNSSWINHRLDIQRMRIKATMQGWTEWTTERNLRLQKLKKIPDALATNLDKNLIAVEIERFAKTPKRYGELIVTYLQEIKIGKYAEVHFVSPPGIEKLIKNSFAKIKTVKIAGETVKLESKHFSRFKFFNFNQWPEVTNGKPANE